MDIATDETFDEVYSRFESLPDKDWLDPICKALTEADKAYRPNAGTRVFANRVIALAALELYQQWQLLVLARD